MDNMEVKTAIAEIADAALLLLKAARIERPDNGMFVAFAKLKIRAIRELCDKIESELRF